MSKDKESKRQTDFNHLQRELSGDEVSHIRRFLPESTTKKMKQKKKREEERRLSLLRAMLMNDPEYAALYYQVQDAIIKAEQIVNEALADIENRIEAAENHLEKLKSKASVLPDGSQAFLSKDGKTAFRENGYPLSQEEILSVQWNENSPAWEDYKQANDDVNTAHQDKIAAEDYRDNVLKPIKQKTNDEENPPTKEELSGFLDALKIDRNFFKNKADHAKTPEIPLKTSAAQESMNDRDKNTLNMTAHFNIARIDTVKPTGDLNAIPKLEG